MPLRLQVVSAHRESMGGSYIQEFSACGGTIGRSLECDWPLPDSKRYISSKHAMIDYQAGAYYLVDLSRNGIYINDANTPVGQGNPQRLFDGDTMRFGEFEIKIALVEDASEGANDGMTDSIVRAQMVQEDESVEISLLADDQIHDDQSLADVLKPSDEPGELSALCEMPVDARGHLKASAAQQIIADTTDDFLKAAGLNPDDFRGVDPQTLLRNAAQLLAEFTEGTHALLSAKDKVMAGLNIHTAKDTSNPLRASDGLENALSLLLGNKNDVNANGIKAIETSFDELLQHQRAVISAMRNALGDYLGYFQPDALERHFATQKDRTGSSSKAFRDQYAQAFEGLAKPNRHKLPQRFDDEFVRAYELETTE